MKWKNKGHEFDATYKSMQKIKKYYLFGAGSYGKEIYRLLKDEITIAGFIDNDTRKKGGVLCEQPIFSLEELGDSFDEFTGIIITVSPYTSFPILEQLRAKGLTEGASFFSMETFMTVFAAYEKNRVYIPSISFLPTTRCNLRCESCLNFTTYMDHFDERPWEQIKSDIDLFFSCIDYIMLFHISGGEPMLYPYIGRLITYLHENYRDKIHILRTVTNGTILPKEELLETLAACQVELTVDDYREAVPDSAETFEQLLLMLEHKKVKYEINKADEWIDLAPLTTHHEHWSEAQLQLQFERCHVPWQELREGKIFSCNYASYAMVAGLADTDETEYFDLRSYTPDRSKELIEFRMGYNDKGYVEFCKNCSGYVDINPNKVPPAKQAMR